MNGLLIVDDSPAELALIREADVEAGTRLSIETATDGDSALALLADRGVDRWPDLALLDLNMPRLGGVEFLSWRRDDERLHRLPVVVLSTSARSEDIATCRELGADGYIVKPRNWTEHLGLVNDLARYVAAGEPIVRPSGSSTFGSRERDAWLRWVRLRDLSDASWRLISRSLDALARRLPP
jgi:CheY-like chemotaxis protein